MSQLLRAEYLKIGAAFDIVRKGRINAHELESISFAIMLLYLPLIAKRIRNEEKVLEEGLDGYKEYKTRVKYKAIPFIW